MTIRTPLPYRTVAYRSVLVPSAADRRDGQRTLVALLNHTSPTLPLTLTLTLTISVSMNNQVRRIDVAVKNVHWSESGALVALTSADSVFVLKCDKVAERTPTLHRV